MVLVKKKKKRVNRKQEKLTITPQPGKVQQNQKYYQKKKYYRLQELITSVYLWEKTKATSNRLENRRSSKLPKDIQQKACQANQRTATKIGRECFLQNTPKDEAPGVLLNPAFLRRGSSDFFSFPFFLSKLFRGYFCCLQIKISNYIKCFISIFKNNEQNQNTQEGE